MPSWDVVVVGGGVAGLAAAARLKEQGRRVLVLEAASRLGGRVESVREPGIDEPIEAGAEFVHGTPKRLLGLLREAGLQAAAQQGSVWLAQEGRLHRADRPFERALALLARGAGRKGAIEGVITQGPGALVRRLAQNFVEGFHGAPIGDASAEAIGSEARGELGDAGGKLWRVRGGYDGLVRLLARGLDVRTDARVRGLRWRRGLVECEILGGTIDAAAAVVAVPLGILQLEPGDSRGIVFDPPLPESHEEALSGLAMGAVTKLVLVFHTPPFAGTAVGSDGVLPLVQTPRAPVPVWWPVVDGSSRIVTGWIGGPRALRMRGLEESHVVSIALQSLAKALGRSTNALADDLEHAFVFDWQRRGDGIGAYAHVRPGGETAGARLSEPIEETLYFAGEALASPTDVGTVHGALDSGFAAAERIAASATLTERGV